MSGKNAKRLGPLDSALLFLSRDLPHAAILLRLLLPTGALKRFVKSMAQRRPGTWEPERALAEALEKDSKLRRGLAEALLLSESATPEEDLESFRAKEKELEDEAMRAALLAALSRGGVEDWELALARAEDLGERLPPPQDSASARKEAPPRDSASKATPTASKDPLKECRSQLKQVRRDMAGLESNLGKERRRKAELLEQLEEQRNQRRLAQLRASELKKQLTELNSTSQREQLLADEAEDARRLQRMAEQKIELLTLERDDLRACLEDHDRFDHLEEEEVPSFRDRPLLAKELDLAQRMEGLGSTFRLLVVGGGEPQYRHREKLMEYAEAMGFTGEWHMAEYVSWHKEMDRLATDMNTRFDALVILHWNRTNFTRKAREICNRAGQKPCITCHYEGFTSLRESLQEVLRQLCKAKEREE